MLLYAASCTACDTVSATALSRDSSSASTITRISGSVPDLMSCCRGVVPIGRTAVSKTDGWGFESLRPCQFYHIYRLLI